MHMEQQLQAIGLTDLQAKTYLYLLDFPKGKKPSAIATALGITRTNCYKVLEQLGEYSLVRKADVGKTLTFFAEDPIALTVIASRARNHAVELEKRVRASMGELQKHYHGKRVPSELQVAHGKSAIINAYQAQLDSPEGIYFIKSRADIPFMSFETMNTLRTQPAKKHIKRYGITPDAPEAPNNPSVDERSGLTRTWVTPEAYTSPVEWTVSGDELAILKFADNGTAVRLRDPIIANAFRELWKLLDASLRADPTYGNLPRRAERKI